MLRDKTRIPNLTSIRFFLALLVILFHTSEFFKKRGFPFYNGLPVFHKGTEAVYVFFSLSGFLIIRQLYLEKAQTNLINLKAFYLRRILRIFPLYYLILAFGFLYYHYILPLFGFNFENNYNFIKGFLLAITFFPNVFSTYAPGGILEILWSIGIEEQFYLIIAPIFLWIAIKKIRFFLAIFTVVYFLLYFSNYLDFLSNYSMLFFYFSFSGFCSISLDYKIFNRFIQIFRYPILILFTLYLTTNLFSTVNPIVYHLFSFILFGIAISALSIKSIHFLENKILDYLGKISYGIYMFHAIVIQLIGLVYLKFISKIKLNYIFDVLFINIIVILLTIITAHFSYKYYESYFLKKKYIKNKFS